MKLKKCQFLEFGLKSLWPYNKLKYHNLLSKQYPIKNIARNVLPFCPSVQLWSKIHAYFSHTCTFPWQTMIDIKLDMCHVICVRCFTLNWANDVIVANRRIHWKMTGAKIPWLNNFWWANTDYYHFPLHLNSLIPDRVAFLVRSQLSNGMQFSSHNWRVKWRIPVRTIECHCFCSVEFPINIE